MILCERIVQIRMSFMQILSHWKRLTKFNFKRVLIVMINSKFKDKHYKIRCKKILWFKMNIIINYLLQNFNKVLINYKFNNKHLQRKNNNNLCRKKSCNFNRNLLR